MKQVLLLFCLSITALSYSQRDSIALGDRYREDQIYIGITYNLLYNQPSQLGKSNFSYGLSAGFIRDIPLNRKGNFALGIGLGYCYDSFNQSLRVVKNIKGEIKFENSNSDITKNQLGLHNLEIPLELRWRTSTATKYNFWRIYAGLRFSYNFSNTFAYNNLSEGVSFNNIRYYNRWNYGLTLSAGYATLNFYFYYGLSPILKDAYLDDTAIKTKIIKLGLIFYLL